ncbi:MAG TPA: CHRD domain-containing protein [Verrucomicrobiota bacterium]|nr:CHRD domain-containing protein [Verrucomicrobiota bacterium]HRZ35955.1 CHRD domain-containing protein [Candidatus Paceibacterota bacterium]HRZ55307.1 CHRD domain-containing protein [Candidatus Paceibacterota bacterium]
MKTHLFLPAVVLLSGALQAAVFDYYADLNGPSESPPVASLGTGSASISYDDIAHTLEIKVDFSGLTGLTTVSHIHAPTATAGAGTVGVAVTPGTLPGFPAGVTAGSYLGIIDLTIEGSYTAAFLNNFGGGTAAGAEAALAAAMADGRAYFNIHTTIAPGGEIRGFLAVPVPEPAAASVFALGLLGIVATYRSRSPAH